MSCGEWVSHTGDIDVSVENESIMASESTAAHHFGKLITFGFQHCHLLDLAATWSFVKTQSFVALRDWELFQFYCLAVGFGDT